MSTDANIEQQWLRQLVESNEAAFRTIYDAYQQRLFQFAVYLTKSPDIAEEIVQEAFIRLWEKRGTLADDSHLLAFLKKVVQNLVLDIYRKAGRDRTLLAHIHRHAMALEKQDPDSVLENELRRVYRQAVDQLPLQQRMVFTLSRDENLSYQEIADQLGLSRHTVRNHMAEAIRSVRKYVARHTGVGCLILAIILHERR